MRSDIFAITPCRALRNLSAATSSVGSLSCRQPRLDRMADEVRPVRPVMGQQGPDRARRPVGQRDRNHFGRPPLGQSYHPCERRLGVGEHRAGVVYQRSSQILVSALGNAELRSRPPVPSCRGTRPSQAASLQRLTPAQRPGIQVAGSRGDHPVQLAAPFGRQTINAQAFKLDDSVGAGHRHIDAPLTELNTTETVFPRIELRMVYEVAGTSESTKFASAQISRGQDV